jgi:hypothetical protein
VPTPPAAAASRERAGGAGFSEAVLGDDWPAVVAKTIESTVAAIHDRVIRPVVLVARALVFGFIIATMALVLTVVVSIALIRLLTVYVFDGKVWPADLVVGGLFCVAGLAAWMRRDAGSETD